MMKKKFNRGFTLIELLVVIAIIGILASVVLAALNSARKKGSDAAIKSDLNNMRAQAALVFNNDDTYGTFTAGQCPAAVTGTNGVFHDPTVIKALKNAEQQAGGVANTQCFAGPDSTGNTAYFMSAKLSTTQWYCVDATGQATTTAAMPSGTSC